MASAFLNKLLHRPMDRKTFIKTAVLGVAVVSGAAGLVQLLGADKSKNSSGSSYGGSAYGSAPK